MEGPHGQLGSGLTDGLGCKNSHSLPNFNLCAMGKVSTITLGTHTAFAPACEDGPYFYPCKPGMFDGHYSIFIQVFTGFDNHFICKRIMNVFYGDTP
jgi:hypothetical protein